MKSNHIKINNAEAPVVMVDDEPLDREVAARYYRKSVLSNPFVTFPDGEAFLAYLDEVRAGSQPMPALVLLDINMPRLNGHEVLQRVRDMPEFGQMPMIAMLTSSTDSRDIETATSNGANDFVVKPYKPDEYIGFFDSLA